MPVAVVIATRNRRERLLETLARLAALPERPRIVVADNGSEDGTPEAVAAAFPAVEVVVLADNRGAAARTDAVRRVDEEVVAFSDDDSWWEPGALARAEAAFAREPRLGLLAACVRVAPDGREDPICRALAEGADVRGFLACGAVVRRSAYLQVGGFEPRLVFRGEERLLAIELARRGWQLRYDGEVVACHDPPPGRDGADRRRLQARNDLWVAWLRRPLPGALAETARALREPRAVADALRGLPWVLRERDPVDAELDRTLG